MWDDHEVENNFAGTTVDPALFEAGRTAFREYMPIGGDATPETLYRTFRWGSDVELIMLDARSFRSDDAADACVAAGSEGADILPGLGGPKVPEAYKAFRTFVGLPEQAPPGCLDAMNDTARTLLGEEQQQFLLDALSESDATFKFVVNPVPISELITLPYDRWEGYRAERDETLRFIQDNGIENVVFLTTDFHGNVVSDVRVNLASSAAAVEFITGPIAHETLGDTIAAQQGEDLIGAFEGLLTGVAQVECTALDSYSYGLVEVDGGTATVTLKDEDGSALCTRVLKAE
jgi:phosphodiesterase/alkaline phosphatase D-like protein